MDTFRGAVGNVRIRKGTAQLRSFEAASSHVMVNQKSLFCVAAGQSDMGNGATNEIPVDVVTGSVRRSKTKIILD